VRIREHAAKVSHEDGGVRQLVDGRVVPASFGLVGLGFDDPVCSDNTYQEYFEFWHLARQRVIVDRIPEYRKYVNNGKAQFMSENSVIEFIACIFH